MGNMSENFSNLAIIISFASVIIAGFSFALNWRKSKIDKLSSESQFIRDLESELDKSGHRLLEAKSRNECLDSVWSFLNAIDRLCYFETKGRLNDDILEYFKNYLGLGVGYYRWIIQDAKYINEDYASTCFPYILKTCKKNSINEDKRMAEFNKIFSALP